MSLKRGFKVSKYRSSRSGKYDSKKEAARAEALKLEEKAGLITDLEEQPVYELIPKQDGERAVKYIADFRYMRDGQLIVEDVKSPITKKLPVYIIKRKLMLFIHGIRVVES